MLSLSEMMTAATNAGAEGEKRRSHVVTITRGEEKLGIVNFDGQSSDGGEKMTS